MSSGRAHGLEWTPVSDARELVSLPWFDQDARSLHVARAILAGVLTDASDEEKDLAVSWTAFAEGLAPRPRYGIREAPVRAAQREILLELEADLAAAGGAPRTWARLGEWHSLPDGTVLLVENVGSDGGIYEGWYCVSRYPADDMGRPTSLLERTYLGDE
jgi:hypothetical protein